MVNGHIYILDVTLLKITVGSIRKLVYRQKKTFCFPDYQNNFNVHHHFIMHFKFNIMWQNVVHLPDSKIPKHLKRPQGNCLMPTQKAAFSTVYHWSGSFDYVLRLWLQGGGQNLSTSAQVRSLPSSQFDSILYLKFFQFYPCYYFEKILVV